MVILWIHAEHIHNTLNKVCYGSAMHLCWSHTSSVSDSWVICDGEKSGIASRGESRMTMARNAGHLGPYMWSCMGPYLATILL